MISKNYNYSFENNLSFENLSSLLNDLSIITHPLSNKQKVCIEYPNIKIENKNINIFSEEAINDDKFLNEEFSINISKNKKYFINPKNLFDEFNKNIPYSFEEFENSLKIFISIFNCFNEDIFKWNMSDFNLFNDKNVVQFIKINKENKNKINSVDFMNKLYQKHFSVKYDSEKTEIIELPINNNKDKNNIDDFEKGFSEKDSLDNIKTNKTNNNLFCYEKDNIFRNIFFLMSLFNLMNKFIIKEYNLDNILKNISKFNTYIINDYKILLLIYFHLSVQINLYIKRVKVETFLDIKSKESNSKNNLKEKIVNNFYPNIFFLDYQGKEKANDESELKKEKIILFNIILKLFNITYLTKINTNLNVKIKIFSISYFSECKSKLIIENSYFIDSNNINYILNFISNKNYVELFCTDLDQKFLIVLFEFLLLSDININTLNNLMDIYYPFIIISDYVFFNSLENDNNIQYPIDNYLNEITILSWALKIILKTITLTKKLKFAFTFVFNSFNIALKKDINNNNNINIQDLMIYMGIYHYNEREMVKYINENINYYSLYQKYKEILECIGKYKNYNINIRLFKNGIINKELQYHFISIILNILNNLQIKNKEFYKNISLYENKFINTVKYTFVRIKKKNKNDEKKIQNLNSINIELNKKSNAFLSPKKLSIKNMNILGKFNLFKNKKENNIIILRDDESLDKIKNKNKKTSNKINNFFKSLKNCCFLKKLESDALINFFKSIKNYFTDFMFYIERINLKNNNKTKYHFIFENTSDSSISFDPINILRNFNNNKCFIILKEFSYIELYIYLYDFYENTIENEENQQKSKSEIYNDIFNNINILKEKCYTNFINKKKTNSSIVVGKINFIIHKYFLILNQYFGGNKIFFNNENKIIILDKFTNSDCILDNGHIDIILNNSIGENSDKKNNNINEDNYYFKFYTAFLYEYDIIKYIVEKKLLKINKLNIIIKRKILQINNGKIQIKKINLQNFKKENNENISGPNIGNTNKSTPKKNNDENIIINEASNNKSKKILNENYNLFKIRDLFKYQNSYPLIIFFLQNEIEISNFSFLLFSFTEIFINKPIKELTKELLIKRITQFFYRFKTAKYIPIIFNKKYFLYFLEFFKPLITKIQQKNSIDINDSLSTSKKIINVNKHIFENLILYPLDNQSIIDLDELNNILNKGILNNLTKSVSLYSIEENNKIKYDINQIGKMFKLRRIKDTLSDIENISKKNDYDENKMLNAYTITANDLIKLIKKNQKKVKFIGLDEGNRSLNVHIFSSQDRLNKFGLDNNNNDENCIIY